MDDLEGYLRQGEPDKAEKAKIWRTAIGLQKMAGLKPSAYQIAIAKQHIEGEITIKEAKRRIDSYHEQLRGRNSHKNREIQGQRVDPVKASDPVNDLVNTGDDTVKGGRDTVNDTVFSLIKKDQHITAVEISERLNISLSTVWRKIKELKEKGAIERIGSDKTGHWKIIEP
ncbi:MAG: winged helix-turn-helix transcriptional regulator [Flavobacteriales bacterium]|nr:winged helix-turn-helix transcriptional regulator [Flavobacteriales bacterium]